MSSVLALEKAEQQAKYLNPDIVILDFGTNDIMYHNEVNPKLVGQTERAIAKFRAINPDVIVVLTSTQDLFYKGHYITAGPVFREVMDSIARANNCMFWNWYDCSGGLCTIKTWEQLGYAKSDNVHLTNEGYAVKGEFIAVSIENTLKALRAGKMSINIPGKTYVLELPVADSNKVEPPVRTPQVRSKRYTVRSGDTLSEIARKNHTTVAKLKSANKLRSDIIKIGQVLVIP
jgi:LysM repeat protein